jgi:hypothetical protein
MVAWLTILAIVPLDLVRIEPLERGLAGCGDQVLLGVAEGQAESSRLPFVDTIMAGGLGDELRCAFEFELLGFLSFKE